MSTNSEELNPQTLEERIITKAMEDPAYKQRLINNAKTVVEEELGDKLGEDITIQVLQQSAKHLYLLLPMNIDELIRDGLITQEELEAVAGGKSFKGITKNPIATGIGRGDVVQSVTGIAATVASLASALYSAVRSRKG